MAQLKLMKTAAVGLYWAIVGSAFIALLYRLFSSPNIRSVVNIANFMAIFLIAFCSAMLREVSQVKENDYGWVNFVFDLIEMCLSFAAFWQLKLFDPFYQPPMITSWYQPPVTMKWFYVCLIPIPILVNAWNVFVKIYDKPLWILGIIYSCLLTICAMFADSQPLMNVAILILSILGFFVYLRIMND